MAGTEQVNWHSFAPITTYDHAGYIWIAVLDCIVISALVLAARAWVKKDAWGHDDTLFAIAFFAQIGHATALFVALKHGLGSIPSDSSHPSSVNDLILGGRAAFVSAILMVFTLAAAKCSLILFFMRLLPRDLTRLKRSCYALLGLIAAWTVASIIALSVDCDPSSYLTNSSLRKCNDRGQRWAGIEAFDAATELLIIALPVALVWPLQMKMQLKAEVVSAFLFRICLPGLAATHAFYVFQYEKHTPPSLAMVRAIVVAEVEICWSLVSAAIPNMKNFIKSFSTGFGHEFGLGMTMSSGYINSHPQSGAFPVSDIPMSNLSGKQTSRNQVALPSDAFGGNSTSYHTQITRSPPEDAHSVNSGRSSEMIIRKNVVTTVEHRRI